MMDKTPPPLPQMVQKDWAHEIATRIIRGYRIPQLRGAEIRDKIAIALRRERKSSLKDTIE